MVDVNDELLDEIQARYVFCLMKKIITYADPRRLVIAHVVPKYTIGWTQMEIKDAPEAAVIPFHFFNGTEVIRVNVQLVDLKLIEKL